MRRDHFLTPVTNRGPSPSLRCLVFFAFYHASTVQAALFLDAGVNLEHNDNVTNAQMDADIKGDSSLQLNVAPGRYFTLDDYTGVSLASPFVLTKYSRYPGLDSVSAGLNVGIRRKLGLGPDVLWLATTASVNRHEFDDDQRDSWQYGLNVQAGKRVSARWELQASYAFARSRSDTVEDIPFLVISRGVHGDAYDVDSHVFSGSAIYTISPQWALFVDYSRRIGEITSTTLRNPEVFEASDAITPDAAFGADRFAYRVDAGTNIFNVGINRAFGAHSSADLSLTYRDSDVKGGLYYENLLLQLKYYYTY